MPVKIQKIEIQKILNGLDLLIARDNYLLSVDANERSITHKLGEYYQQLFLEWNVDCEYNKNLLDPKIIQIDPRDFLKKMANLVVKEGDGSRKYFSKDEFSKEDLDDLAQQLQDENNVLYDDELDLVYFVMKLTNNKKIVKTIFPDIIIHHRGTRNNYIVIETKKSQNINRSSRLYDLVKLVVLVNSSEFNYKQGFFIDIPTGSDISRHENFKVEPLVLEKKVFQVKSK